MLRLLLLIFFVLLDSSCVDLLDGTDSIVIEVSIYLQDYFFCFLLFNEHFKKKMDVTIANNKKL